VQTRSPKLSTSSDYLRSMTQGTVRWRRWGLQCPSDEVLAGYIDGALEDAARSRTESHLANCAGCRSLIADVVTMQRLEATPLPLGLKQRAIIVSTAPNSTLRRWVLIPATAASIAFLLIAGFLLLDPRNEIGPISSSPAGPVVAESEKPLLPGQTAPNIVRRGAFLESLPTLISPRDGRVIGVNNLVFKWKRVARARYYEISVVTSEGDPVWQVQSNKTEANLSSGAVLKDGTYFVWVTAYLADGRLQKSPPVSFVVNARR